MLYVINNAIIRDADRGTSLILANQYDAELTRRKGK